MSFLDSWTGAYEAPTSTAAVQTQRQQQLFDLQQKQRGINALQGWNPNDNASNQNAMTGLIRAGQIDQANALMNLNWTRNIRSQLPPIAQVLGGATSSEQPAQAPQSAPAQPDPQALQQAADATQKLGGLVHSVQQAAPEERSQIFEAGVKGLGVDPNAAALVRQHLGDANFSTESLDQILGPLNQHAQTLSTAAQAVANPNGSGINWGHFLDPRTIEALDLYKSQGLDFTNLVDTARAMQMPQIQAAAEIAKAGPIAAETEAVKSNFTPIDVPEMVNGQPTGRTIHTTVARFLDSRENGGYGGQATALSPAELARQEEAARGQYHPTEIKMNDGSVIQAQPRTDKNGNVTWAQVGAAGGAAGGAGGPSFGHSQTPGQLHTQTAQADQATALLQPDPHARQQASDNEAQAERALTIVAAHRFDNLTPMKVQIANALRTAGFKDDRINQYASDMAGYQANAASALATGAHQAFPSRTTDNDIKLLRPAFQSLTTPKDQASFAIGLQAAQAHRETQLEDFKANYGGDKSTPQAVQRQWLAGPGGQSIYQSPVWSHVTIGGRPAFNPATDVKTVNGVRWGAWGLGTGHPVYFRVQ